MVNCGGVLVLILLLQPESHLAIICGAPEDSAIECRICQVDINIRIACNSDARGMLKFLFLESWGRYDPATTGVFVSVYFGSRGPSRNQPCQAVHALNPKSAPQFTMRNQYDLHYHWSISRMQISLSTASIRHHIHGQGLMDLYKLLAKVSARALFQLGPL